MEESSESWHRDTDGRVEWELAQKHWWRSWVRVDTETLMEESSESWHRDTDGRVEWELAQKHWWRSWVRVDTETLMEESSESWHRDTNGRVEWELTQRHWWKSRVRVDTETRMEESSESWHRDTDGVEWELTQTLLEELCATHLGPPRRGVRSHWPWTRATPHSCSTSPSVAAPDRSHQL